MSLLLAHARNLFFSSFILASSTMALGCLKVLFHQSRVQPRNQAGENRFVFPGSRLGAQLMRSGRARFLRNIPVNLQLRHGARQMIRLGDQPVRRVALPVPEPRRTALPFLGAQRTILDLRIHTVTILHYLAAFLRATQPSPNTQPVDLTGRCTHRYAASKYPWLFRLLPVPVRIRC